MHISIDTEHLEEGEERAETKRTFLQIVPSWLFSFFVHMIFLLSLATLAFPVSPVKHAIALLSTLGSENDCKELSTEIELVSAEQPSTRFETLVSDIRFDTLDIRAPQVSEREVFTIPEPEFLHKFFGVYGSGQRFAFVIDRSSSMKGTRFSQACDELMRSVNQLKSDQFFYVVFFDRGVLPMFGEKAGIKTMLPATPRNQKRLESWVRSLEVGSGTKPYKSIRRAMETDPDTIYLLTDGRFNGDDQTIVFFNKAKEDPKRKLPFRINTIGFEHEDDGTLDQLAENTGGSFQFVPKQ